LAKSFPNNITVNFNMFRRNMKIFYKINYNSHVVDASTLYYAYEEFLQMVSFFFKCHDIE